ncbi:MAG TPA: DedA family protein [Erwinia sp.]|uniref:YqaA family protein n=1 Tax=Erwinia citreus TaxID=558 RepID=UPI000E8D0E0A|nr:YqaA family protein [Erwinia sp.]HBV40610.1 DedA family protein [Erwinia sp.]
MSDWLYGSMFVSGFLSATLLPGNSEVLLVSLLLSGKVSVFGVTGIAALGNTLGGLTNVIIGRCLPVKQQGRWHNTATAWLHRWGPAALLLSWLPVIGDLLCVLAGWLRFAWFPVALWLAVGKALRYSVLAFATLQGMEWWQ